MIRSIRIDGLMEGEVALYDLPPPTRPGHDIINVLHTVEGGSVHPTLANRHGRLLVPTHMHVRPEDIPTHVNSLASVATAQLGWTSATLLIPTREPHQTPEGERVLVAGYALLEGPDAVPDADPVQDIDEASHLAHEWYQGVAGFDIAHLHPALRNALTRLMTHREETTARWLADEPRRLAESAARGTAASRSRDLLRSCLDADQLADFDATGGFNVRTPLGGGGAAATFRVLPHHAYNVQLLDASQPTLALCAVTSSYVPVHDQMLAQKLLLESDPAAFLRTANRQRIGDIGLDAWERIVETLDRREEMTRRLDETLATLDEEA